MSWFERLTGAMSFVAGVCVFAIIGVTLVDVVANNVLRHPIRGTYEVVELLLVMVVFCGLPEIFRMQRHIVVDVVDHFVTSAARGRLILAGSLVTLAFLAVLGFAMIAPAMATVSFPENRQDSGLPTWVYWVPILLGVALCIVATVFDVARRLVALPVDRQPGERG